MERGQALNFAALLRFGTIDSKKKLENQFQNYVIFIPFRRERLKKKTRLEKRMYIYRVERWVLVNINNKEKEEKGKEW